MKPRTLSAVIAAIYVISGIVAVVAPARQLALYGVAEGPAAVFMARWAGLGSVVVGLLAWLCGRLAAPEARRALLSTLLVYFVVAGILSLAGTISSVMSGAGWVLFAVNMLLSSCSAYFLVTMPRMAGTREAGRLPPDRA